MPTYGYRCKNGHEFEVVQSFSDAPLQRCPQCRTKLSRIYYPIGIVFKGSGFYKTDSRAALSNGAGSKPAEKGAEKGAEKSTEKPAAKGDKADSKPAKTEAKPAPKASKET